MMNKNGVGKVARPNRIAECQEKVKEMNMLCALWESPSLDSIENLGMRLLHDLHVEVVYCSWCKVTRPLIQTKMIGYLIQVTT